MSAAGPAAWVRLRMGENMSEELPIYSLRKDKLEILTDNIL